MEVLATSCLCVDVYDDGSVYPGGNALNFAAQCARSGGCSVGVLGSVGRDDYGDSIRRTLRELGIPDDYVHDSAHETAWHAIHIDATGDRCFADEDWHGGGFERFRIGEADALHVAKHDLVATTFNDPSIHDLLDLRRSGSFAPAIDFQETRDFAPWTDVLDSIDFVFVSGDPGALTSIHEMSRLHTRSLFVATLGADGSVAFEAGREHQCAAVPVREVIDTTGCGDAYQAAFALTYCRDKDVQAAMRSGATAAAEIAGRLGGV
ncbi:MAG: PfkB family carbohydrate kinase [Spirochaetota bacterium]